MRLSVVTTTCNSETKIGQFVETVHKSLTLFANQFAQEFSYQILVIDDSSEDHTIAILRKLSAADECLRVIRLSRRVGQHRATLEGLRHSDGDFIFLLDSDLEEDPFWLLEFWRVMHISNVESVHGEFDIRHGPVFRRLGSRLFWVTLTVLGAIRVPGNATMARLLTRKFVDSALANQRASSLLAIIFSLAGKSVGVRVNKPYKGSSAYSYFQKSAVAIKHIIVESRQLWWRWLLLMVFASGAFMIAAIATFLGSENWVMSVVFATGALFAFLSSNVLAVGVMIRGFLENQIEASPSLEEIT